MGGRNSKKAQISDPIKNKKSQRDDDTPNGEPVLQNSSEVCPFYFSSSRNDKSS